MIPLWLLYGLFVGALLAGAAWLLEGALRLNGRPVRWVWAVALLARAVLVASAPRRMSSGDAAPGPSVAALPPAMREGTVAARLSGWQDLLATARRAAGVPLSSVGRSLASHPPRELGTALAIGWAMASAAILLACAATLLRTARARRGWRRRTIQGAAVRVAPAAGPMVVGVVRPAIVLPRWLLLAPAHEQRMVLAHEQEHIRARDPLLLLAGCLLFALLPWNPAVWWMAARLRLAVELDCDARVLRAGGSRTAYGAVLLDVTGRRAGNPLGAPAFLESPAQLERRLLAMTSQIPRFATLRGLVLAALSAPLALAACDTSLPSAPEIEQMNVAAVETGAQRLGLTALSDDPNTVYLIDGETVTAKEARALEGHRIAAIEVKKSGAGSEPSRISVFTPEGLAARGETAPDKGMRVRISGTTQAPTAFDGLLLIDGERVESSRFPALDPDAIESIEVLKGPAATRLYSDPAAANGVIRVTTKKANPG